MYHLLRYNVDMIMKLEIRIIPKLLLTMLASSGTAAWAEAEKEHQALQIKPFAIVGGVAYDDTVGGRGAGYAQNANGIFNVHTDAGGGHSHGGDFSRGLNLQTLEAGLHAQAPGWGEAALRLSSDGHDFELEEAWLRSREFMQGAQVQGGRFFSAVGQQNDLHPHAWDFVDQALPYQMLLAGGLRGDGLQVNWLAPLGDGARLRLSAEALRSDNEGVAAQTGDVQGYVTTSGKTVDIPMRRSAHWPQVWTAFAKADWNIAPAQLLSVGLATIGGRQHQELHTYHPGINDADHALQGSTRTDIASLGWQREGSGEQGAGDVHLTAEYFRQRKDLLLVYHDTKPWNIGMPRQLRIDGYVLQALYGIAPRWQVGVRIDSVGNVHEALRSASPANCAPPYQAMRCPRQNSAFDALQRASLVATWNIDRHQRLRVQMSRARVPVAEDVNGDGRYDAVRRSFNQVFLQYQLSFGGQHAHAH